MRNLILSSSAIFLAVIIIVSAWDGELVFEDNFDGNSLDLSKWEYQEACGNEFGGNNLQCYNRNNVVVRDGNLVITVKKENQEDKEYTSGRIRQIGKGFVYGAYVARARLVRGDHLWPAIWLLVQKDCRYEEIDIAEYRGQPSEAKNIVNAGHWGRSWDALVSRDATSATPVDLSSGFHEFAVLWRPAGIEWYVDNVKYFEAAMDEFTTQPSKWPCVGEPIPFSEESHFIFNVAVGGGFFNGFPPMNVSTWSKLTMEVDWVRIYRE